MKKYHILMIIIIGLILLSSCATEEMIDRSFTYFNEDGKYYVEVDVLVLDEHESMLTVTVKWTPTHHIQYTLSTSAYGKAGLLTVEIEGQGFRLYSSDDVILPEETYVINLEINEKISRNILFSIYPFTQDEAITFPSGSYVLSLYNREELVIQTTISVFVNQQDTYELSMISPKMRIEKTLIE